MPPLVSSCTPAFLGFAAALCLMTGSVEADNLISNPSFESGMDNWEVFVGPEFRSTGAVYEGKTQDGVAHDGTASGMLTTDLPIRYGFSSSNKNPIPVDGGGRYRVSAWVKFADDAILQPGRGSVYLRLALLEGIGHPTQDPLGNIQVGLEGQVARTPDLIKLVNNELPRDWQKIEAVVDIPEGQSLAIIGLFAERISGAVYWDDVVLERVEKDTPLSPIVTK